jgi:CheY-like chemotaxis protein
MLRGDDALALIVDEDMDARRQIRQAVESVGMRVAEAANPALALDFLAASRPRVMLVDLRMPGMGGLELAFALRGNAKWRELRVVLLAPREVTREQRMWLTRGLERIEASGSRGDLTLTGENAEEQEKEIWQHC